MTCQEWRKNAERFIQRYINCEKNTDSIGLNQVYIRGPFIGRNIGSVLAQAKELLKTNGHTTQPDTRSGIQKDFPFGHHYFCTYGVVNGQVIPCDCGLHDALKKEGCNDV